MPLGPRVLASLALTACVPLGNSPASSTSASAAAGGGAAPGPLTAYFLLASTRARYRWSLALNWCSWASASRAAGVSLRGGAGLWCWRATNEPQSDAVAGEGPCLGKTNAQVLADTSSRSCSDIPAAVLPPRRGPATAAAAGCSEPSPAAAPSMKGRHLQLGDTWLEDVWRMFTTGPQSSRGEKKERRVQRPQPSETRPASSPSLRLDNRPVEHLEAHLGLPGHDQQPPGNLDEQICVAGAAKVGAGGEAAEQPRQGQGCLLADRRAPLLGHPALGIRVRF